MADGFGRLEAPGRNTDTIIAQDEEKRKWLAGENLRQNARTGFVRQKANGPQKFFSDFVSFCPLRFGFWLPLREFNLWVFFRPCCFFLLELFPFSPMGNLPALGGVLPAAGLLARLALKR